MQDFQLDDEKQFSLLEKFSLFFIKQKSQYLKIFWKIQGCEEFLLTK